MKVYLNDNTYNNLSSINYDTDSKGTKQVEYVRKKDNQRCKDKKINYEIEKELNSENIVKLN